MPWKYWESAKHALTENELQHVTDFIENYAKVHAILLPGRIPGLKDEKAMLLPSSTSKRDVYLEYERAVRGTGHRVVAETTFYTQWRNRLSHIYPCKPMTDLCSICQQNSTAIVRSGNAPIERQPEVKT